MKEVRRCYTQVKSVVFNDHSSLRAIFDSQEPVLLQGMCNAWPALSHRKWSLPGLKARLGDRIVCVEAFANYMDPRMKQIRIKFSDYCDYIISGKRDHFYLAQQMLNEFPELEEDIITPQIVRETGRCALQRANVWIGPPGVFSPCHYDLFNNVLCQVIGTKKVILYNQDQSQFLYPAIGTQQKNTSLINSITSPDEGTFPMFKKATGYETELNEGDALFIPLKMWHYCEATSASVSVNFWWL